MHTEAAYSGVGAIVELACAKRANIFYPPLPVKKCPPASPGILSRECSHNYVQNMTRWGWEWGNMLLNFEFLYIF